MAVYTEYDLQICDRRLGVSKFRVRVWVRVGVRVRVRVMVMVRVGVTPRLRC